MRGVLEYICNIVRIMFPLVAVYGAAFLVAS